ncbi:motility associated factor glycosyltransferase family protein [Pseudoalteromonas piscicida]|uniref:motility associated factor glycosyltransferase family protein n=1 Tax=Pseudoalteromonas piscicida TaxID=43662 RepID=UPI0032BFF5A9
MDPIKSQLETLEVQLKAVEEQALREELFIEAANLKFERNLKAFKSHFPEIYEKYLTYEPNSLFNLFVNPNGSANIIDYKTGVPMYSEDPVSQIQKQTQKNIENPILGRLDHSGVAFVENGDIEFLHVELMRNLGEIFVETKSNLAPFKKLGSAVPNKMIFGIGLGYHLEDVIDACKAGYVNIFEPNEDYFFASLFVSDWVSILEKIEAQGAYLYLGVGVTEHEIYEKVYSRSREISVASVCHSWFYQHYPSVEVNKWIAEFKKNYHQFFAGFGFFDDAMIGIANSLGNVKNNCNFMFSANEQQDKALLHDIPAVVVANGPSLDANIEPLKRIQDKVIIFACNSATTALIKHGIIPDFHVALERTKSTYYFLKQHIPESMRKDLNLLVTNVMHPDVAGLFGWAGMALKPGESGTQMLQLSHYRNENKVLRSLSFSNPLVGNTALSYACHLGFKDIYLFGVDNGYIDPEHHHSKASFYYSEEGETVIEPTKIGGQVRIPGNFCETVLSDEFMYVGNCQMERILESFLKENVNCYNCSNGAKIKHSIPLESKDILLPERGVDKHQVVEHIKTNLFAAKADIESMEKLLCEEEFEQLCGTMVELLEEEFDCRESAQEVLLKSLRYLYSFRNSADHLGLYQLLEGEALYTSSILISILHNFGDDYEVVPYFRKALKAWVDFLKQCPEYYRQRNRLCQ